MSNRLYVANISFNATDADLKNHFASFGVVNEAKILNDRDTGRSRGFGFVTMASSSDADNAIQGLNNQDFLGRRLFVSIARERGDRGPGPSRGNSDFQGGRGNSDFQSRPQRPYRASSPSGWGNNQDTGRTPDVSYKGGRGGFGDLDGGFAGFPAEPARPDRGSRRARNQSRPRDHDDF